jgi:hypothetical protein
VGVLVICVLVFTVFLYSLNFDFLYCFISVLSILRVLSVQGC